MYELAELFTLWEPEDAKSVFDNEWRPDLGTITDEFVRTVIEKIFILDPAEQPTTRKIIGFFQTLNSPAIKAEDQHKESEHLAERSTPTNVTVSLTSSTSMNMSKPPLVYPFSGTNVEAAEEHLTEEDSGIDPIH